MEFDDGRWYCNKFHAILGNGHDPDAWEIPCDFCDTTKSWIDFYQHNPQYSQKPDCNHCIHHTFEGSLKEDNLKRKGQDIGIIEGKILIRTREEAQRSVQKPVDRFSDLDYEE